MRFESFRHDGIVFGLILVFMFASLMPPRASVALEGTAAEIKAAMMIRFIGFIEWPASDAAQAADRAINIGIMDEDGLSRAVEMLEGHRVNNRKVHLVRPESPADALNCQILYMSAPMHAKYPEILQAAAEAPILSIGETARFIDSGGIMRFYRKKQHIRFEISVSAAAAANLRISAELLEIARLVK